MIPENGGCEFCFTVKIFDVFMIPPMHFVKGVFYVKSNFLKQLFSTCILFSFRLVLPVGASLCIAYCSFIAILTQD